MLATRLMSLISSLHFMFFQITSWMATKPLAAICDLLDDRKLLVVHVLWDAFDRFVQNLLLLAYLFLEMIKAHVLLFSWII